MDSSNPRMNAYKRSESRKHNRLVDWNYSEDGYYFVTVCVKDQREVFGKVENDEMVLNECGEIVKECWQEIEKHFEGIELSEFIVMPNHVHGIIIIGCDPENKNYSVGNRYICSLQKRNTMKLSKIVGTFKAAVTRRLNVQYPKLHFQWQKSFYDHIIRDEKALEKIYDYIRYNATKWELDRENPIHLKI